MRSKPQFGVFVFAVFASAFSTITRRDFVPKVPTVTASDDLKSIPEKHPFGILKYTFSPDDSSDTDDSGERSSKMPKKEEMTKRCEAVLIAHDIILTSPGCAISENDKKYKLLPLATPIESKAVRIAFLSWVGDRESESVRWMVQPKPDDGISYYLSTPLSYNSYPAREPYKANTERELKLCSQVDRQNWIGLECKHKVICDGSTVLDGAAVFTTHEIGNSLTISVHGLVAMKESGKFCKAEISKGVIQGDSPNIVDCGKDTSYVCAKKFSREDVAEILATAKRVNDRFKANLDVLYLPNDETIIGTFNLKGAGKFTSSVGIASSSTMRRMITMADIFVLQEASNIHKLDKNKLDYLLEGKGATETAPTRKYGLVSANRPTGKSEHVFLFDKDNFACSTCETVISANNRADKCVCKSKKWPELNKPFVVYSVHLTPGTQGADARQEQWRKIVKNVHKSAKTLSRIIIAGDTNVGGGEDSDASFKDLKATVKILKDFSFPDPGATTVRQTDLIDDSDDEVENDEIFIKKESRFDRFAISKNLRLVHRYFPVQGEMIGTPDKAPIERQSHRLKYYYYNLLPKDALRQNEPEVQSFDLSDHLILYYNGPKTKFKICSWNMMRYDPTAKYAKDHKSVKYSKYYADVLQECHIVAVQELVKAKEGGTTKTIPETAIAKSTAAPAAITIGHYTDSRKKKKWYWSLQTWQLGFRVNNDITLESCLEITLPDCRSAKNKTMRESRNAFSCTFTNNDGNQVTLVSMHVLNDCKSQELAATYIGKIEKIHEERKETTFVMGDFNIDYPATMDRNPGLTRKCKHKGKGLQTYTKVNSLSITDHIYYLKDRKTPGVQGCRVINPDTYKINDAYVIPDKEPKRPKRQFNNWARISDHYPSYIRFEVP